MIIHESIHESWHKSLQPLFNDPKMEMIRTGILSEPFYPASTDIFNVFKMPLDKVKVVILGQDPYSKGEAIGYSFAVGKTTKIPRSLEIIKEEIINSKVERDTHTNIDSDNWRTLQHWRQQGVFLLNAALTVRRMDPGSHMDTWHWFTRQVLSTVSIQAPVWMLWGGKAKGLESFIKAGIILKSAHPAAEAYNPNAKEKFSGCNHFNLCNQALKNYNKTIINW